MKLFKLLLSAIVVLGLSSCLGSSSNTITQEFTPYIQTYVVENATGNGVLSEGAVYKVFNDIDNGTLSLEIKGLKMPNNTTQSFTIENQRYSFNEQGAMVVRVPSYTTTYAGITHTITNLNYEYYSRYMGTQAFPIINLSFDLDGEYMVRAIYSPAYYWGTTTVVDQDGKTFVNSDQSSFYGIQFFPETKKATIGAFSAKFAEGMPALNMTFEAVPFTLNQYSYSAEVGEVIPKIGGTPYPDYKITDLKMSGTWGGQQYLQFTCTITKEDKETHEKVVTGTYRVSATLSILPPKQSGSN